MCDCRSVRADDTSTRTLDLSQRICEIICEAQSAQRSICGSVLWDLARCCRQRASWLSRMAHILS